MESKTEARRGMKKIVSRDCTSCAAMVISLVSLRAA